jgi:hypothetical protein
MNEHPDIGMIERFTIGAMEPPAADELVAHVAACDACSETLAREARLELALREVRAHRKAAPIATRGRRGGRALAAVLLLAAAAAVLFLLRRPPTAAPTSGPDPSAGVIGDAQAKLFVRVAPDQAKIFLDDAPLQGNPASLTLPRDGRGHVVRAEAPGYQPRNELVVVDSAAVKVELILERDPDDEVDPFGNKLIAVTLASVPSTARLYLDGVLQPTNPLKAKFPRDGKRHELKAAEPGFITKTGSITFDRPRADLVLTLDRAR